MADWDNYEEGGIIDSEELRTEMVNRMVAPIFFLIDVSSSMSGEKIMQLTALWKKSYVI